MSERQFEGEPADTKAPGYGEPEGLSIEQVSASLGVPTPTIRSWERRYGIPLVDRTRGGHRRYSSEQVDTLRRLRDLVAHGLRPAHAAAEVRVAATAPGAMVESLLRAAVELDPVAIADALDTAHRALGLDRAVDEVLLPAMRRVGEWWESGEYDIAHEHLATSAAQAWLARVPAAEPAGGGGPVVLCCGPRDHHTLGLEALGAMLRHQGRDCRLLGARTPRDSLVQAVQETEAAAVVLVSHLPAGRATAVDSLRAPELRQVTVFFAGGAFATPQSRRGVPGHYLGTNFARATKRIVATLDAGAGEPPHPAR